MSGENVREKQYTSRFERVILRHCNAHAHLTFNLHCSDQSVFEAKDEEI